jgi:hypothetical protein
MNAMLAECRAAVDEASAWIDERRSAIAASERELVALAGS